MTRTEEDSEKEAAQIDESFRILLITNDSSFNGGNAIPARGYAAKMAGSTKAWKNPVDTEVTKPAPLKRRHLRRSQVKNPAAEDYCSRRISGMEELRKSGENEL